MTKSKPIIKSITIENFKKIQKFSNENKSFEQINIITGDNNTGKTTLLEALFLATGIKIENIFNIHFFRRLISKKKNVFDLFFCKNNKKFQIKLKFSSNENYSLSFEKRENEQFIEEKKNIDLTKNNEDLNNSLLSNDSQYFYTAKYGKSKEPFLKQNIILNKIDNASIETLLPKKNSDNHQIISSQYLHSRFDIVGNTLDILKDKNKKKILIDYLKEYEPNLNNIELYQEQILLDIEGINNYMPINMLGSGIIQVLNIIAAISYHRKRLILIDEIENGIHHSKFYKLIEYIFQIAINNEHQIFIVTHSKDFLDALRKYIERDKDDDYKKVKKLAIFEIYEKDNETKLIKSDYKDIIELEKTNIDLRG